MKGTEDTRKIDRYIALDIHKEYVLAGGQTAGQEWALLPRRISMAKFGEWAKANLQAGDAVVLETTTNVWDSGKEHIEKHITKSGRRELRWALVEAAWQAIRISPYWKEQYETYLRRMRRPNQAIVVIARKLLVAVWHVLIKEETDLHAIEEDLACKMLVLAPREEVLARMQELGLSA